MNRVFGWMPVIIGATALFIIAGCSSTKRPGDPGDAGRPTLCPEKAGDEFSPCMEAVCGDRSGYSAGTWSSTHRGIEYVFDCEACKTRFDDEPEHFTQH